MIVRDFTVTDTGYHCDWCELPLDPPMLGVHPWCWEEAEQMAFIERLEAMPVNGWSLYHAKERVIRADWVEAIVSGNRRYGATRAELIAATAELTRKGKSAAQIASMIWTTERTVQRYRALIKRTYKLEEWGMDPDACLKEIRELLVEINKPQNDAKHERWLSAELAERVEAMDEWLSRKGFLPAAWTR